MHVLVSITAKRGTKIIHSYLLQTEGKVTTPNAAPRRGEVPYSDSAERQLIGAVLNDEPTALAERVNELDPVCFFVPENRAVWRAFGWLWHRGEPVTVPTVCHALAELGYLDALDKLLAPHLYAEPFLFVLMDENYSAYGCGAWAKMVKEYAERRALIKTGTKMVQQGYGAESKWVDKYEGMF